MAIYWGRLEARNSCVPMVASDQRSSDTKLYSKLNKIEGAITDGE